MTFMYNSKFRNMDKSKDKIQLEDNSGKMALPVRNIRLIVIGFAVLVLGYLLMVGGGTDNPEVFSWDMFSFRRLVLAPVIILAGIVLEIVAAVKIFKKDK